MTYTQNTSFNQSAVLGQGQQILPIPSYDMPSYDMSAHVNVPLSTTFNGPQQQQVHDPALSGSYVQNVMANTPSSYAHFVGGLLLLMDRSQTIIIIHHLHHHHYKKGHQLQAEEEKGKGYLQNQKGL